MKHILNLAFLLSIIAALAACTSDTSEKRPADAARTAGDTATADTVKKSKRLNADGIDTVTFNVTDTTITLKQQNFPTPGGRVVNVMVTGVDSRLGDPMGHADANHLVRFFLDSGFVEIISIPRDTPSDAGFDDTTGLNKLTNVRANRGRNSYLKAVCEIANVPKIDYYVEFGFSQAIGLLEMLGYKDNAASTLRVLRSRQAYSAGDFQRVYNQGQFMRQIMLRHFEKTDGLIGDLALRAALALVETNLSYDTCSNILDELRSHGFGTDASRVWVRLKPAMISKFTVYDFSVENVNEINKQIDHRIHRLGLDSVQIDEDSYERRLSRLVEKASADSAKSPGSVIRLLRRAYEQRAWLQVPEQTKRRQYRDRLCGLLGSAYRRTKNHAAAQAIDSYLQLENGVSGDR